MLRSRVRFPAFQSSHTFCSMFFFLFWHHTPLDVVLFLSFSLFLSNLLNITQILLSVLPLESRAKLYKVNYVSFSLSESLIENLLIKENWATSELQRSKNEIFLRESRKRKRHPVPKVPFEVFEAEVISQMKRLKLPNLLKSCRPRDSYQPRCSPGRMCNTWWGLLAVVALSKYYFRLLMQRSGRALPSWSWGQGFKPRSGTGFFHLLSFLLWISIIINYSAS